MEKLDDFCDVLFFLWLRIVVRCAVSRCCVVGTEWTNITPTLLYSFFTLFYYANGRKLYCEFE